MALPVRRSGICRARRRYAEAMRFAGLALVFLTLSRHRRSEVRRRSLFCALSRALPMPGQNAPNATRRLPLPMPWMQQSPCCQGQNVSAPEPVVAIGRAVIVWAADQVRARDLTDDADELTAIDVSTTDAKRAIHRVANHLRLRARASFRLAGDLVKDSQSCETAIMAASDGIAIATASDVLGIYASALADHLDLDVALARAQRARALMPEAS